MLPLPWKQHFNHVHVPVRHLKAQMRKIRLGCWFKNVAADVCGDIWKSSHGTADRLGFLNRTRCGETHTNEKSSALTDKDFPSVYDSFKHKWLKKKACGNRCYKQQHKPAVCWFFCRENSENREKKHTNWFIMINIFYGFFNPMLLQILLGILL